MKQNINEIKKMQLLAGLITEGEYRDSLMKNEEVEEGLSLTPKLKSFIDKSVRDAKRDGDFEDLIDVDYFENDFIDFILEKFDTEGDYGNVSQEVKDYIANAIK